MDFNIICKFSPFNIFNTVNSYGKYQSFISLHQLKIVILKYKRIDEFLLYLIFLKVKNNLKRVHYLQKAGQAIKSHEVRTSVSYFTKMG